MLLLLFVVVVCFAATGSFVENERLILLLLSGLVKAVKEVKVREKELQESLCSRSIALKLLRCRDKHAVEEAKHAFMCMRWINEESFPLTKLFIYLRADDEEEMMKEKKKTTKKKSRGVCYWYY